MVFSYELGRSHWRTFREGIEKEWLITNGIGGYANQSVTGANHRMFNGYLNVSLNPPADRFTVWAGTHESVTIDGKETDFAAQEYVGTFREGQRHLVRFVYDGLPTYIYQLGDMVIRKTVAMVYGSNTSVVCFEIENGRRPAVFRTTPLFTVKPLGSTAEKADLDLVFTLSGNDLTFHRKKDPDLRVYFRASEGVYEDRGRKPVSMATPNYMIEENQVYHIDNRNGFLGVDHHATPYDLAVALQPGEKKRFYLKCSVSPLDDTDGFVIAAQARKRLAGLADQAGFSDPLARKLTVAADAFIVDRQSTGLKTVLAGYPWFLDWGRDTMIALQGLTLCTRRFEDARQILASFAKYVRRGLLPNNFPNRADEVPGYNTIDASLWYFYSVDRYLAYTGEKSDFDFIRTQIYPALKEIIAAYRDGTDFGIGMDGDGLIRGGSNLDQLTWMDVRVGDWVVTPRHGKPVEINALWYHALRVMAALSARFAEPAEVTGMYTDLAELVKKNFRNTFWNEAQNCLYDVVGLDEQGQAVADAKIRPNQIYAVFLPHSMLHAVDAKAVVDTVFEKLYTPYGIRSLSPDEPDYQPEYIGKLIRRDGAYHMGTAWGFISGAFISAYCKVHQHSPEAVSRAYEMIQCFADHLNDGCLNGIAEIFDGDFANTSRGCYSQAWSVSEVLRAYAEDVLPFMK